MIDFRSLVKAGVHFGHQTARWNPKMRAYIWGHKNKVHLIDVSKTAHQLEKSAKFLEKVVSEGREILWVGTKKPAQVVIHETAIKLGMPYVTHRWIGGTLSNYSQVRKSVTKLMHYQDIITKSEKIQYYTKKEINVFQKMVGRLEKNIGGVKKLSLPLGAVVLVDVRKERSALKEALVMGIPVVALIDTNGDPTGVDYVIPTNDDAPRAIKIIVDYLAASVEKGQVAAAKKAEEDKAAKAAKKEEAVKEKAAAKKPADKKVEPSVSAKATSDEKKEAVKAKEAEEKKEEAPAEKSPVKEKAATEKKADTAEDKK